MIVKLERTPAGEGLALPHYATPDSAGMDLRAAIENTLDLKIGERMLVACGFKMVLPRGCEGQIRPRSGLALKHGITVLNSPGTIDADYRGEIKVILINLGQEDFVIERGMRIAQLVISPILQGKVEEVTDIIEETDRRGGGFGSTGLF